MRTTHQGRIHLVAVSAAVCLAGLASARDGGPLLDDFPLTLHEGQRTEALGPLFSWERQPGQRRWAVHPLLSMERHPEVDRISVDVFYPLFTYDRSGPEYRWQFLQLLSSSGGADQQDRRTDRFTLFPVLFWQRSEDPERDTFAVLPLYGHLERRLFRDEIDVVLFPLWSRTRKRDVVTENWLYPLFHTRHGEGLQGWQFWPLYGREEKQVTWRTNLWGEEELVAGHSKRFVLWPFYVDHRTGLGTDRPLHQRAIVPFYATARGPHFQSTSWGWPLGLTRSTNSLTGYQETAVPWPFVVRGHGPHRSTHRFWPFYGLTVTTNQQRQFCLWPLWQSRRSESPDLLRHDRRVGLFLYRDLREDPRDGTVRLRRDLWPLGTYRQEPDGKARLQVLAPLEPILPANRGIERNYSPLWSLWRMERDPATGRSSRSLLWNLFRSERDPEGQKCSLLFGLVQHESRGGSWRLRLLGLPLQGPGAAGAAAVQADAVSGGPGKGGTASE